MGPYFRLTTLYIAAQYSVPPRSNIVLLLGLTYTIDAGQCIPFTNRLAGVLLSTVSRPRFWSPI